MSKIKSFEANSIHELEESINNWLREEFINSKQKVNIKFISHSHTNSHFDAKFTALIVYEYC